MLAWLLALGVKRQPNRCHFLPSLIDQRSRPVLFSRYPSASWIRWLSEGGWARQRLIFCFECGKTWILLIVKIVNMIVLWSHHGTTLRVLLLPTWLVFIITDLRLYSSCIETTGLPHQSSWEHWVKRSNTLCMWLVLSELRRVDIVLLWRHLIILLIKLDSEIVTWIPLVFKI